MEVYSFAILLINDTLAALVFQTTYYVFTSTKQVLDSVSI